MNVNLSWDLFILVFFAVVVAYSFIIGRNQTLKVITATYLAVLCADGVGNLFAKYFAISPSFLKIMKFFAIGNGDQATAFFKVLILIFIIVIVAVRGLFTYNADDSHGMGIKLATLLILGVLSGGLMVSAMLIFISGGSLVANVASTNNILSTIYPQSRFVRIMLDYANLWFVLPGAAIIMISLFNKKAI